MLAPNQVLDKYYLDARCMLIEVAAILDRYERAKNSTPENGHAALPEDPRIDQLYQTLKLLSESSNTDDRSEQVLNLFSDLD